MKIKKGTLFTYLLLLLLVAVMLYPILFAVANSFKTQRELYGPGCPPPPRTAATPGRG